MQAEPGLRGSEELTSTPDISLNPTDKTHINVANPDSSTAKTKVVPISVPKADLYNGPVGNGNTGGNGGNGNNNANLNVGNGNTGNTVKSPITIIQYLNNRSMNIE